MFSEPTPPSGVWSTTDGLIEMSELKILHQNVMEHPELGQKAKS
jgi:hypothetical protein